MRKLSTLLITLLLLTSCAQEVINNEADKVKGKEVVAHFALNIAPVKQITLGKTNKGPSTRSTVASTIDDKQLTDLWIVQFDNAGNFMKKEYCTRLVGGTFDAPLAMNYTGTTSTIYFLANIGPSYDTPDTEAAFKTFTKNFSLEADLFITDVNNSNLKSVPMFGKLTGVTVSPSGYIENFSVELTHMLTKITLNYDIPTTANFGLEGIQLRNVTAGLQYFPPATTTTLTSYPIRDLAIEATTASSGTLVYYLPENQRGVGTNTDAAHNERLKDGLGTNAPNGTYVEFSGHVIGTKGGDKITCRYYFGTDDYNDYNLVRNQEYAITTSIDGSSASDRRVSIPERANCYMVMNGKTAEIPVTRANESDLGIQLPDTRTGWTASLYWSTPSAGIVTVDNTDKAKGYFKVTAHATNVGNALVVIKDGNGVILWSWHIWVDDEDMNTSAKQDSYNGMTWMNRNLGATYGPTSGQDYGNTGGFLYEWGRKEPFLVSSSTGGSVAPHSLYNGAGTIFVRPTFSLPAAITTTAIASDPNCSYASVNGTSAGLTNQLKYAVQNPMLFISDWRGSTAKDFTNTNTGIDSWGGEFNQPKALYDPCPAGWRVPSGKRTSTSYNTPWNTTYTNTWGTGIGNGIYGSYSGLSGYPLVGYRGSDGALQSGTYIMQWAATASTSNTAYRNYATGASSVGNDLPGRGYGYTVRCVKNWFRQ